MRLFKLQVFAAIALLLASACNAASPSPSGVPSAGQSQAAASPGASGPAASGSAAPITLKMWYYDFPPAWQFFEERIRQWTQVHPDIQIDFDHTIPPVGVGGFEDKTTASLAAGTAPDIFVTFNPDAIKYITNGQLAPIDDAAAKAMGFTSVQAVIDSRLPGSFSSWQDSQGQPYGLQNELYGMSLFCSDAAFKKAGLDPDKVSFDTWDDLVTVGKQVIAADKSFYQDANGNFTHNFLKFPNLVDDGWSMQVLTAMLAQSGGTVLSADGTQATINSPEGVAAVQKIVDVGRALGDPNVGPAAPGDQFAAFSSGDQTCALSGPFLEPAFLRPTRSPILGAYHVYRLPYIDASKPGNVFWGWAWSVNAASQHKVEAWEFINYLLDDPQGLLAATGSTEPIPGIEKGWGAASITGFDKMIAGVENGQLIQPISVHYSEVARILRGQIETLMYEGGDVKAALDSAASDINAVLKP